MSEPFLAEIRIVSFNFTPRGWAQCSGQLLSIAQNQGLFSILGTTYGGNGQTTFALPDLRGRMPIHVGTWGDGTLSELFTLGQKGGLRTETLGIDNLPVHSHTLSCSKTGGSFVPSTTVLPGTPTLANPPKGYATRDSGVPMSSSAVNAVGNNQAHENTQPSLGLMFIIALQGIFPSQN